VTSSITQSQEFAVIDRKSREINLGGSAEFGLSLRIVYADMALPIDRFD
jgi:hypothetical protein